MCSHIQAEHQMTPRIPEWGQLQRQRQLLHSRRYFLVGFPRRENLCSLLVYIREKNGLPHPESETVSHAPAALHCRTSVSPLLQLIVSTSVVGTHSQKKKKRDIVGYNTFFENTSSGETALGGIESSRIEWARAECCGGGREDGVWSAFTRLLRKSDLPLSISDTSGFGFVGVRGG